MLTREDLVALLRRWRDLPSEPQPGEGFVSTDEDVAEQAAWRDAYKVLVDETDFALTSESTTNGMTPPLRLVWYRREDGLWNAACACHATLAGWTLDRRAEVEAAHFDLADKERARRMGTVHQIPPCGPKLPEPNPNIPGPLVFP